MKNLKFRIYPNKTQKKSLISQLNLHRDLYNLCLLDRDENHTGYVDQIKTIIPKQKSLGNTLGCNYSSLQQTVRRLEKSYQAWFESLKLKDGRVGKPRIKKRFRSIEFSKYGDGWKLRDSKLYIQNVGLVKIKLHREVTSPQRLVVTKKHNKWYVCIIDDSNSKKYLPQTGNKVAIDLGVKTFATMIDSVGNFSEISNPKFLQLLSKSLESKNTLVKRNAETKLANSRLDFCHKETNRLIRNFDEIFIEDLKIQPMVENGNRFTNKYLLDVCLGQFIQILTYKAENAGRKLVKVNPAYTTQMCSKCGRIKEKTLDEREHNCSCGLNLSRDQNAAKNIYTLGLQG